MNNINNLNTNVSLIRSVNGGSKLQDNSRETLTKNQAIAELKNCNYRTPPKEIAFYLETIFGLWEEKPQHWLYIAQHYSPKSINSVISQMVKMHQKGSVPLDTPGAYFTRVLKSYHKPRIGFRATNGGRKQQDS